MRKEIIDLYNSQKVTEKDADNIFFKTLKATGATVDDGLDVNSYLYHPPTTKTIEFNKKLQNDMENTFTDLSEQSGILSATLGVL